MPKVLLFNPRSARSKPRIPNSILSIAASIEGMFEYVIVDGNMEDDPLPVILAQLSSGDFVCFATTSMPGPQLKQSIPYTKTIKTLFPEIQTVWGGYFPSNQSTVVLESGFVDYVVNGPGDKCFPLLMQAIVNNLAVENIPNLVYKKDSAIIRTPKDEIYEQDELPSLPYETLNRFYPIEKYLGRSFMGTKTIAYHSSMGCPFSCSFCAVVPIYKGRWKGKSAPLIYSDIKFLKDRFGGNAIEFHDNNFFVSEKRTVEFAKLISKENMKWWGEGRIDTINKYSDDSLSLMRDSGCRMIFFGAETGNDAVLKKMDKGGTQSAAQIRQFAERLAKFNIIPEYSFVLGTPADTPAQVMEQIDQDIAFIREIKTINPDTEIVIYVYSPVPTEGSEMYKKVLESGFKFPEKLEDWISPQWEKFDLRKNPLTPWLSPEMIDKIKDFETVLNGYYPTVSDVRLTGNRRKIIKNLASLRYKTHYYKNPYELKALQILWKYRQPEIEGM
jgi:anaerobic magnesium-protoporphyrin IX monomethyl ester cyclase